jgi:hypothetical protein
MAAVGIIVNPWAGKDVRRLHAAVGHTPDSARIGIVRRVAIGALDAGARRVYAAADSSRVAARAIAGLDGAELVAGPGTGSALDTRRAAGQLLELDCTPIVVLGGDGTCRDAAIGGPGATLLAISTGTNNVFPRFIDGSSAGTAAGLVASGRVPLADVTAPAKRLVVTLVRPDGTTDTDIALVDVAAIASTQTGSRAVVRASAVRGVVAAIAHPSSTGLSAIAGRLQPIGRDEPGAVHVRLGDAAVCLRRVRVPIVPGQFDVLGVGAVERLMEGDTVTFDGPVVLAYDGERERHVPAGAVAYVRVDRRGPAVVDVDRVLLRAAVDHLFDEPARERACSSPSATNTEAPDGH